MLQQPVTTVGQLKGPPPQTTAHYVTALMGIKTDTHTCHLGQLGSLKECCQPSVGFGALPQPQKFSLILQLDGELWRIFKYFNYD